LAIVLRTRAGEGLRGSAPGDSHAVGEAEWRRINRRLYQSRLMLGSVWRAVNAPAERCRHGLQPLANGQLMHILNYMVQYQSHFDASFAALSDATRRGVLEQLVQSDASITQLADRFGMTLTGMKKHVVVLEQAGLVATRKVGRVRTCRLGARTLADEAAWIERYRQLWAERFNALDTIVEELKQQEKADGRETGE
jgi:DNA-binding transcriptional ArsR family regulator